jgi:hypothetical protein
MILALALFLLLGSHEGRAPVSHEGMNILK